MIQLEKDIETKLRKMVERCGGRCRKFVCPSLLGAPDRIILLPGGRIIFAETKRPKGGKRSKMQEWWAKDLKRLGFWHAFVYTEQDIETLETVIKFGLEE